MPPIFPIAPLKLMHANTVLIFLKWRGIIIIINHDGHMITFDLFSWCNKAYNESCYFMLISFFPNFMIKIFLLILENVEARIWCVYWFFGTCVDRFVMFPWIIFKLQQSDYNLRGIWNSIIHQYVLHQHVAYVFVGA